MLPTQSRNSDAERLSCIRLPFRMTTFGLALLWSMASTDVCFGSRLKNRDVLDHAHTSPDASDGKTKANLLNLGSLSIRTWQWNSGKKNLEYEVEEIFEKREDTVDVIAICLTEAAPEKEVHTIVEERGLSDKWALVGYGKHTGMAGGSFNAQILSVFLRQPIGKPYKVTSDPVETRSGLGYGLAGWQKDYISPKSQIPGVLSTKTMIHQTSGSGKGGVSTVLSFDDVASFEQTSVALICAHLDSEDTDDRRTGLTRMLDEPVRGSELPGPEAGHLKEWPCQIFDSTHPSCTGSHLAPGQPLNAVVLMGDLNFRLRWLKDDSTTAPYPTDLNNPLDGEARLDDLFTAAGRHVMSIDDPLNPKGTSSEVLVQDAPHGFAFLCDEPYDWLPSYKRESSKAEQCVALAKKLRACGQLGALGPNREEVTGNCTDEEVADLAADCFKDKKSQKWKLKTEKNQPIKKRSLQLGWLDRVCFRSVGSEPMSFKIRDTYHWDDHIYEKDDLSDHSPIEMTLTVSTKNGMCPLKVHDVDSFLSPGSARPEVTSMDLKQPKAPFRWLQASQSYASESTEGVYAECPSGFHFDITPVEGSADKQQLKCEGGSLKTSDKILATDLTCKRYCGPLETPDNGKRLDEPASTHPRAAPFVTGSKSRFACESFYVLSGASLQTCGPDGTYGTDAEDMKCLRTCTSVTELQSEIGTGGTVALQRSPANKISEEATVAEGDQVEFGCSGSSPVLSDPDGATVTCTDSGRYDRPLPKCLAKCGAPLEIAWVGLKVSVTSSLTGKVTTWAAGKQVLEGDVVEFSCVSGSLQGVAKLQCESDGTYHPYDAPGMSLATPETPTCLAECAIPPTPVNGALAVSVDGPLAPDGQLHYSCNSGCAMLGAAQITCKKEGVFDNDPPECKCDATLHLIKADFSGVEMSKVNTMKLKLYPLSLASDAGSGHKGYDKKSYNKLPPKDFHDLDLSLDHDLDSTYFHVELCESSIGHWLTFHSSRCDTIAISTAPRKDSSACPLCFGTILQQVSTTGTYDLVMPLTGKGVQESGTVTLTLSLPAV